ncbi:MAG: hypothetical protein DMG39_24240 [Acidobacteria bacterium]|nr:MAG: hypothetical protein DMG39_24240 [Acidobacteriota bacterium]
MLGFCARRAALANTDLAPATLSSAKSTTASYDPSTNTVTMVNDPWTIWGNSVVWTAIAKASFKIRSRVRLGNLTAAIAGIQGVFSLSGGRFSSVQNGQSL